MSVNTKMFFLQLLFMNNNRNRQCVGHGCARPKFMGSLELQQPDVRKIGTPAPFLFLVGGLLVPSCVPIFTVNSYEIHVVLTPLLSSLCVYMSQLRFCDLIMSLLFLKAV